MTPRDWFGIPHLRMIALSMILLASACGTLLGKVQDRVKVPFGGADEPDPFAPAIRLVLPNQAAEPEADKKPKAAKPVERISLSDQEFETLLKQLDSSSFREREHATATLSRCGPEVLGKLAIHFFDSSSEAVSYTHLTLPTKA